MPMTGFPTGNSGFFEVTGLALGVYVRGTQPLPTNVALREIFPLNGSQCLTFLNHSGFFPSSLSGNSDGPCLGQGVNNCLAHSIRGDRIGIP